ncbi:hypothetical protein LVJ94_48580 [Pendulispora rubella]|uniref:DUF2961 domain-containing protein n=1 Tax=Pendulispora rubella TaxID=2741070 RepID=A0ABZ2L588_9BACT
MDTARRWVAVLPFIVSCQTATSTKVRAVPPDSIHMAVPPVSRVLPLPPRGEMRPDTLGDGTPVWVVRGLDDAVSLVVPFLAKPYPAGLAVVVPWVSDQESFRHRFVWNAHGRVLGNEGWGDERYQYCFGESDCPSVASLPTRAQDLDTYAARRLEGSPERVEVGERIPGRLRDIPQRPIDRSHRRRSVVAQGLWPEEWPRLSIPAALTRPEGTMVFVDGDVELSSGDAARICWRGFDRDHLCPPASPRIYDMDGLRSRGRQSVMRIRGPFYARRFRDGFIQVVARTNAGRSVDDVAGPHELVAPATLELAPWIFVAGGARMVDGPNRAIPSLGGGGDVTFGFATFGRPEAYGGRFEIRLGPWGAMETTLDRVRGEGGLAFSLGQVRHARWGTFAVRAGGGHGSDGSSHLVGVFTWGVRYVPGRDDPEHDALNPRTFALASGARLFAAVRTTDEPAHASELVFGLEFEPTWFLPPYSLFKWGGVNQR